MALPKHMNYLSLKFMNFARLLLKAMSVIVGFMLKTKISMINR